MTGRHYIGGQWIEGTGSHFNWRDPATQQVVWEGRDATPEEIAAAVGAARKSAPAWAALPLQARSAAIERLGEQLKLHKESLAQTICHDTGKPRWEARAEVDAMIAKIGISIQAYATRRGETQEEKDGIKSATRFKPHGVVAVLGPFNMPGHLPHGHIVPALLAGNTVIFKPSDMAPATAEKTMELWNAAVLPPGVINMLQGGRESGAGLVVHPGLDGLFFTGSRGVGQILSRSLAERPETILALEMGGNNPLVVANVADIDAAVYAIVQSAFITAGQRCTCARRLIVPESAGTRKLLDRLIAVTRNIRVGTFNQEPEPFMGPVISVAVADNLLEVQSQFLSHGGVGLLPMQRLAGSRAMLSPGLVDATRISERPDVEIFGPLLQIIRVADFAEAIREANCTKYGLAAALLSDSRDLYEQFFHEIRAGVVNWNRPTTGASSNLPFGGVGWSGNHRPSGTYAIDYCAYPVASQENRTLTVPAKLSPGILL